jgi:hypothetical protein
MKTFKITDIFIQIVLIVVSLVYALFIDKLEIGGIDFFTGYFVVGGWQMLSVIVHFFYKAPYPTVMRRLYLLALLVVTVLALLAVVVDPIVILVGEILLFFAPVMALYYLVVCFVETKWLINKNNVKKE